MSLANQLLAARDLAGYSQDEAADAIGVSRAMLSYWESEKRRPSDAQMLALARLYRISMSDLLSDEPLELRADEARMMFRSAVTNLSAPARRGLGAFIDFLDVYARMAKEAGLDIRGMRQSPFGVVQGFESADDARRKAEEVRAHLRLGLGPIGDMDWVCELLGITVYRGPLGSNLEKTISGAFFNHPEVGFSILVNLQMTPGRRRFTLAHELGHALFHSDKEKFVVSGPSRSPRERFADQFAGEFLMPTEGIRRALEEHMVAPRISDPADVVHLQRFFNVSYITALVRLRQANIISQKQLGDFKDVRPVIFAQALGYEVADEEFEPNVDRWRVRRFPPRFLRLLRHALVDGLVSPGSVAELLEVSIDEVEELFIDRRGGDERRDAELNEYRLTGVVG